MIKSFIKNNESLKSKHKTLKTGGFAEVDVSVIYGPYENVFFTTSITQAEKNGISARDISV